MAGVAMSGARQRVRNSRRPIDGGDGEAGGIEAVARRSGRRSRALLHVGGLRADYRGERGGTAGTQVEHASAAAMPQRLTRALDVGMQGVGDEGPVRGAE